MFGLVGASLGGTSIHVARIDLPYGEAGIIVTLQVAAAGLPLPRLHWPTLAIAFCVLAGILHRYACGEPIVGSELTPLVAYLVGLATVQTVLATLIVAGRRRLRHAAKPVPTVRASLTVAATFSDPGGFQSMVLQ